MTLFFALGTWSKNATELSATELSATELNATELSATELSATAFRYGIRYSGRYLQ